MEISKYATDKAKSIEGVWVVVEHDEDGNEMAKLLIAKANNTKFQEYLRVLSKPYQRQIAAGVADDNMLNGLLRRARAKYILLDWDGLLEEGEELPYNQENAEKVLQIEYFSDLVEASSNDMALFLENADAEDLEKLKNG
jgi:hypothetical protein